MSSLASENYRTPDGCLQVAEPADLWIEIVSPSTAGQHAPFFAAHTVSMSQYGAGIAEIRVKFNLSAYVRYEIAKAAGR